MTDKIQELWEKGNEPIKNDKTFSDASITKSISESSKGITAKLIKTLRAGIVFASLATLMFIYNFFFYLHNLPILLSIIGLFCLSGSIIIYLIIQIEKMKTMDSMGDDLHSLLIKKIRYFNTNFQLALYCTSLSIVLPTIAINLTMENSDGIFELRKIIMLSVFYLFAYLISILLLKITHSIYSKQLNNALFDLEEDTFHSIENELNEHKKIGKIILTIVIVSILVGLAAMVLYT